MSSKVWEEIIYIFPNWNGSTLQVWEWINNFMPHFIMDVISYPCWYWNILRKGTHVIIDVVYTKKGLIALITFITYKLANVMVWCCKRINIFSILFCYVSISFLSVEDVNRHVKAKAIFHVIRLRSGSFRKWLCRSVELTPKALRYHSRSRRPFWMK